MAVHMPTLPEAGLGIPNRGVPPADGGMGAHTEMGVVLPMNTLQQPA